PESTGEGAVVSSTVTVPGPVVCAAGAESTGDTGASPTTDVAGAVVSPTGPVAANPGSSVAGVVIAAVSLAVSAPGPAKCRLITHAGFSLPTTLPRSST